jgi:hypothetical protein
MLLALVMALTLRVALFVVYQPWRADVERTQVVQGDEASYQLAAQNIMAGHGYSFHTAPPYVPSSFKMPGYAFFLSVVYRMMGCRPWVVLLLHIGLSLATMLLLYDIGRRLGGRGCGLVGMVLFALCPLEIVSTQTLLREPLALLLTAAFWSLWTAYVTAPRWRTLCLSAFVLGVSVYVRENPLYLPFVLGAVLIAAGAWRRVAGHGIVAAMLFGLCFAAPLAPWAARNYQKLGTWSLTTIDKHIMLTCNAGLLLADKHNYPHTQMIHALHEVLYRQYTVTNWPPEFRNSFKGVYQTNDALLAQIAPKEFRDVVTPRRVLDGAPAIAAAEARLGVLVLRDNIGLLCRHGVIGGVRVLVVPLWQELMRITRPKLDSMAFVRAVMARDTAPLRHIGWGTTVYALATAALMTGYDIGVVLLCLYGLVVLAVRCRNALETLSWWAVFLYTLAVATGPNAVARFRMGLLPLLLPLAAYALVVLYQRWRGGRA